MEHLIVEEKTFNVEYEGEDCYYGSSFCGENGEPQEDGIKRRIIYPFHQRYNLIRKVLHEGKPLKAVRLV